MTSKRYPEEFKIEAVRQVTEQGHSAAEVAARLEVSSRAFYQWIKRYGRSESERIEVNAQQTETRRLKAGLKRERIRRRIYATRDEVRRDIFDYIELFYNPKRRHGYSDWLSPVEYEKQSFARLEGI